MQEQYAETQIDPTFTTESALSVQRLMQIASDLSEQRQFIDAERIYAMVQDRDPNIAEAYARRGETLEFLGRYDEAIEQWEVYQTLATSQYDRNRATRQISHIETVVKLAKLQEEIRNRPTVPTSPPVVDVRPTSIPSSMPPASPSAPVPSSTRPANSVGSVAATRSTPSALPSSRPPFTESRPTSSRPPTTTAAVPARPSAPRATDGASNRRVRIVNSTRVRFAGNEKYEQKRFIELHLEADQARGPIDLNKISIKYCFFDRDKNYPKEIRLSSAQPIQRLSFEQDYSNPSVFRINLHLPYLVAVGTRAREQRTINRYLEYHGFFVRLFYDGVEQSDGAPIIRPPNVAPTLFKEKYLRHVGANGPL